MTKTATLNECKIGENLTILSIPSSCKAQLVRMGLSQGDQVECISKIPGGPVVIMKDLIEIAIGQGFAKQIEISR